MRTARVPIDPILAAADRVRGGGPAARTARVLAWVVGLGALSLLAGVVLFFRAFPERVSTCRLSPDETMRAWLIDLHFGFLDQNYSIRLERLGRGGKHETVTLVRSTADEGRPPGSERLIWSKDGTKFLLVGRHFYVRDDLMLDGGDQLYFLHDVPTGRSWLNSESDPKFPPLTADLIAGVEFTEPVVLRPRAKVAPDSPGKPE